MKTNTYPREHRVPVRFASQTRFPVSLPAAPVRSRGDQALDGFKSRLLEQILENKCGQALEPMIRHAANEAAALAWTTPFPLLVLPGLLEEKVRTVWLRDLRQRHIQWRSRKLVNPGG
jgi:hypothetical protein